MSRYIKWSVGFFLYFCFLSIGCYFWYQWDTAPYRKQAAEIQQLVGQSQMPQEGGDATHLPETTAAIPRSVAQGALSTETTTAHTNTPLDVVVTNDTSTQEEEKSEPETTEPVVMSPFGFGPYPEIPAGFPNPDIFEGLQEYGTSDMGKAFELQKRLIVEFYRQGKSLENVGVSGDADGRVYLSYPDVIYVKWDYWTDEAGITHKYAGVTRGHPDAYNTAKPYVDKGLTPPGITVYELPDGYIDAYEYLGLNR